MTGSSIRKLARRVGLLMERATALTVPSVRLVQELRLRKVNLILDIGANDGGYGQEVFDAGYSGQMISFEPLPDARRRLVRVVKKSPNWTLAPALALSDTNGTSTFYEAGNSASSSLLAMNEAHVEAAPESAISRSFEVKTARLDDVSIDLGCDRPHFMKIDVQGGESLVLSGAQNTISYTVGIQIEMSLHALYAGQSLWREIDDLLTVQGFHLWDVIPGFRHRQSGQLMQFDGVYFRG